MPEPTKIQAELRAAIELWQQRENQLRAQIKNKVATGLSGEDTLPLSSQLMEASRHVGRLEVLLAGEEF